MKNDIDNYIKSILETAPSEEMYIEAVRDVFKDLIKEYIRKKINEDEDLKRQIEDVLEEFMEARIKQYDSMAKMAKITAKIGILSAPKNIKDEAINDFLNTFKNEIDEIIKRTL
ncbi:MULTISPECIES: hypothetical protein [Acidiplasma]|jgi:ppGpp synthetase/RelA/SpoT-type nucleotidyltranferase|uniref:Nitrite reductase n=2 Tax=Acidiplasma TaxID=507753 RepID=A0A0Q1B195_9ARCH|nr:MULTISPECIES: hypothetical protein [Acidiplasma]KJE48913.1 nitrite reductase [Acidiplasma sp. MBA-1]KPV46418.1 nitrite reductase [Acidiplasma aeolicum]KQB33530.1 nitrite reductase [Acidiplasma cupricumulans]KQB33979.1 nitrite reductase [Acidiplasma aeolicum]WMT54324.1 MAG: nitrite reductase [Acidiplasma sp.]